ncbi:hypothetical protein BC936DRAFT_147045 [Jimgerdemannia flammicorona]|uniref:Uncharacterized protein n=1 Tax=Jimgerdemannia flammicorona TaxID=994334 RepID=A0A433D677_9FUNG|nr:hypothetical protein BC936DRAFT_147045 [Jimgerdemannia flammicorona]
MLVTWSNKQPRVRPSYNTPHNYIVTNKPWSRTYVEIRKEALEKKRKKKQESQTHSNSTAPQQGVRLQLRPHRHRGLNYRPRTKEPRATYALCSAANDVLKILKTDTLKDLDKKLTVEPRRHGAVRPARQPRQEDHRLLQGGAGARDGRGPERRSHRGD